MEKIAFDQLQEELFYEKMDNGLEVYVLQKKGFNKTYATFTTKYGSIDNRFIPLGKDDYVRVPDGIAHFLEHKMFEKEDGDVFQHFSKQGASANAFTSFTRTAYLFSSTSRVHENLETLLNFVQEPYFTEQTVEKEKGIIGQEIRMYDDNPDWQAYFGLIQNMYHHHPVKIDIAGTVESIADITKDHLYECYRTFYHPSNMLLFVVGSVDPKETIEFVRANQGKKDYKEQPEVKRAFEEEPEQVKEPKQVRQMNVQTAKCEVGLKAVDTNLQGKELQKREAVMNVLLDALFGKSSPLYYQLYREGLIDETFYYDFTQEKGFGFAMVGGNTAKPEELAERVKQILMEASAGKHLTEEALQRSVKKKIGSFLRSINSPEYIANQFTRYAFNGMNLFDVVPVYESVTLTDVMDTAKHMISEDRLSTFQILPK
ncbi:EF-P 5-aminopentanol modification-associated protein YfmH [Bacillus thermotolerans]|uniref:Peptidase, M16 family n=1 Tax=Bacillus thermotolerans TaxID=1221996 RepID=A0A0F5I9X7_BACTR|nr:pitrilysin family protein [Bacillus thermotolerans]KKB38914.1 peptidase, M16 family [Bacillus thermotolerans]KKB42419.1 peptidase, M16 family [Bacillus thermotolerans]KKB44729.1 peptidase, M16 family [Bacillus thermotolerans]